MKITIIQKVDFCKHLVVCLSKNRLNEFIERTKKTFKKHVSIIL